MTETTTANIDIVLEGFDALNQRDRTRFEAVHHPEAVVHDVSGSVTGIQAIGDLEFSFFEAFADLSLSVEDVLEKGKTVIARWTFTGIHQGEFRGIAPTGSSVEIQAMGWFNVEDGLIAEVWLLSDRLGLLEQIGALD